MNYNQNSTVLLQQSLDKARNRLLDLTSRNRLLNFKFKAKHVLSFADTKLSSLFSAVDADCSIQLKGVIDPPVSDWVDQHGRLVRPAIDLTSKWEVSTEPYNLYAPKYSDELASQCRSIQKEAELAIQETGVNMLFLIFGFLEYPDQRVSDKILHAPLISVPVAVSSVRASGIMRYSIAATDEEPLANLALTERLRNDYGIVLPEFNIDLGIDHYLTSIVDMIKPMPLFKVSHQSCLSFLNLNAMRIYFDLDIVKWNYAGGNGLLDNPIIRSVLSGVPPEKRKHEDGSDIQDQPLTEQTFTRVPLVFDADSSQHGAIAEVLLNEKNVVIEGPPGTGKSQTITNLIAAALSQGKSVLFVAEKLAALEVVQSRLDKAGLSPFVLELHSNKTDKRKILSDLDYRLNLNDLNQNTNNSAILKSLITSNRHELNSYVNALNSPLNAVIGSQTNNTLYQVIGRVEKARQQVKGNFLREFLYIKDAKQITDLEVYQTQEQLRHLGHLFQACGYIAVDYPLANFIPNQILRDDAIVVLGDVLLDCINTTKATSQAIDSYEHYATFNEQFGPSCDIAAQITYTDQLTRYITDDMPTDLLLKLWENLDSPQEINDLRSHSIELSSQVVSYKKHLAGMNQFLVKGEKSNVFDHLPLLEDLAKDTSIDFLQKDAQSICSEFPTILNQYAQYTSAYKKLKDAASRLTIPESTSLCNLANMFDALSKFPRQCLVNKIPSCLFEKSIKIKLDQHCDHVIAKNRLEESLQEIIHLDVGINLTVDIVAKSIAILRQGNPWYKCFSNDWRKANDLFESVAIDNNVDVSVKIQHLTLLHKWLSVQILIKQTALPTTIPSDIDYYSLDDSIAFVRWLDEFNSCFFYINAYPELVIKALRNNLDLIGTDAYSRLAKQAIDVHEYLHSQFSYRFLTDADLDQGIDKICQVIPLLKMEAMPKATIKDLIWACNQWGEGVRVATMIQAKDGLFKSILGDVYQGINTDADLIICLLDFIQLLNLSNLPHAVKDWIILNPNELGEYQQILDNLHHCYGKWVDAKTKLNGFGNVVEKDNDFLCFADRLIADVNFYKKLQDHVIKVNDWYNYLNQSQKLKSGLTTTRGTATLVAALEAGTINASDVHALYEFYVCSSVAEDVINGNPSLSTFSRDKHEFARSVYQSSDIGLINSYGTVISSKLMECAHTDAGVTGARVSDRTEMALISHLIPQQKPRVSVRSLLSRAGTSIQALKPCFLMGPQAVSQFLEPNGLKFDLVIMDEASQLTPENALGAIARGKQLVVVGDSKQLPPTSFFSKLDAEDDEDFAIASAESILDICSAVFQPTRSLKWHYRSQHQSLIAFSNHHFYKNSLIIFPSPYAQGSNLGVRAVYLKDAIYENQTNLIEAMRVVKAVKDHVRFNADVSLGIVTLNTKQRDLIDDLIETYLAAMPEFIDYVAYWRDKGNPLFVKNLENVQGDERDAIFISITYGKPSGSSVVRQNFGPISKQTGWRRLNVLFTRAKKSITLYTSLLPEDISVHNESPEGTKVFRNYLEYARSGVLPIAKNTGRDPDSDFEIAVMNLLEQHGYRVVPQLGVAGYRIDLAVKHPDRDGVFLAAIECDGATYHSSLFARDRDRIRQELLESMGWRDRIWRIWSTDWFRSPQTEMNKLVSFLDHLSKNWKPEDQDNVTWVEEEDASAVDLLLTKPKIFSLFD